MPRPGGRAEAAGGAGVKRPAPMVLIVQVRGEQALLRAGGSATRAAVRDVIDYVLASCRWSRQAGGWVVPVGDLPDVRAGAELRRWVVRDVT